MKKLLNAVLNSHVKSDIYPIFVRNSDKGSWKKIEVKAATYKKAIDIACAKHLNKWLNFTLARKMDLISARVDAAKASKNGKPCFIVLVKDEFIVTPTPAKNADLYAKFVNGGEDKEFIESLKNDDQGIETKPAAKSVSTVKAEPKKEAIKINDKNNMSTKTAKKVAKKAAKKVPAKKAKSGEAKKRSIYGFGLDLLELLKKGSAHPMDALTKKFKVKNSDVSFQIAAIKSNGYKVERTEKGYKIVK